MVVLMVGVYCGSCWVVLFSGLLCCWLVVFMLIVLILIILYDTMFVVVV